MKTLLTLLLLIPSLSWGELIICENKNNKDKFFEYMFIDSGIIVGILGAKPPLMKTRKEIKIEAARKEYQQLITSGWQVTEPKW